MIRLLINNQEIDTGDDLKAAVSYSIADINKIDTAEGSISKTITIPATKSNKQALGYPEEINSVTGLDQTQAPEGILERDGTEILKGVVKITDVVNRNGITSYKVVIVGNNAGWKNLLLDKRLPALDFSDYNHTYNTANVDDSELTDSSGGALSDEVIVYPLIDYGEFTVYDEVNLYDRLPSLQCREILQRIFKGIGYTIKSDFVDSDFFKKLYMPFTGDVIKNTLTDAEKQDFKFRIGQDDQFFISSAERPVSYPELDAIGTTTYYTRMAFNQAGTLDVTFNTALNEFDVSAIPASGAIVNRYISAFTGVVRMRFTMEGVYGGFISGSDEMYAVIRVNGSVVASEQLTHTGSYTDRQKVIVQTDYIDINSGDVVDASVKSVIDWGATGFTGIRFWSTLNGTPTVLGDGDALTVFYNEIYDGIWDGSEITASDILPDKLQIDFIRGLKHLFNLYFDTDINKREVLIEPRDDFYIGTALDWTDKLDISKDVMVQFLGSNFSKTNEYKYLNDSDDKLVDAINKEREITLAAYESNIIENEFAQDKETSIVNPFFAPTFMGAKATIGLSTSEMPKLWAEYEGDATSVTISLNRDALFTTNFAPRILYYDGIKNVADGEVWTWEGTDRVTYPYMYSVNENDANNNSLYFNDKDTSNGLFKKYYTNLFKTINEGRRFTAYFNLNDVDIAKLDFRKPIYLEQNGEGAYFILNKIFDYSTVPTVTKVELVTLLGLDAVSDKQVATDYVKPPPPPVTPKSFSIVPDKGGMKITGSVTRFERNLMLGRELKGGADDQVILGQRNKQDSTAKLIIAAGTLDEPDNLITIDELGKFNLKGGYIYAYINGEFRTVKFVNSNNELQEVVRSV